MRTSTLTRSIVATLGHSFLRFANADFFIDSKLQLEGYHGMAQSYIAAEVGIANNAFSVLSSDKFTLQQFGVEQNLYVKWATEQTFAEVLMILPEQEGPSGDIDVSIVSSAGTATFCKTIPSGYSARFECAGTGTGILFKKTMTSTPLSIVELRVYQSAHIEPTKPYKQAIGGQQPTTEIASLSAEEANLDRWFSLPDGINSYRVTEDQAKANAMAGSLKPVYVFDLGGEDVQLSSVSIVCTQYNQNATDTFCNYMNVQLVGDPGAASSEPQHYDGWGYNSCIPTAGTGANSSYGAGLDFDCTGLSGKNLMIQRKLINTDLTSTDLTFSIIDIAIYPLAVELTCSDVLLQGGVLSFNPSLLEVPFEVGHTLNIDLESEVAIAAPFNSALCSDRTWEIESIVPTAPLSALDLDPLQTLSLSPALSDTQIGTHDVSIKVTVKDESGVPYTGFFDIKITVTTCPSQVTFTPLDSPIEVQIGQLTNMIVSYPTTNPASLTTACHSWSLNKLDEFDGLVQIEDKDANEMTFSGFSTAGSSEFELILTDPTSTYPDVVHTFSITVFEVCDCVYSQSGEELLVIVENLFETSSLLALKTITSHEKAYPFTGSGCLEPICSFTYDFSLSTNDFSSSSTVMPSELTGPNLVIQPDLNFKFDRTSILTLTTAGEWHGKTSTVTLKAQEVNTGEEYEHSYTIQFYCHQDATIDILPASSASMTFVEGQTPEPISFTLGATYSAAPLCWNGLETICEVMSVSGAASVPIVISCNLESGIGTIQLDELDGENVGVHTLQVTLSDTGNPAFRSFAEWSITVVNEEVCDPELLFLTQVEGPSDLLPEKTLEIVAGDPSITYNLPLMGIESLEGDPEVVASSCAPIDYKVVVKDTAGEVLSFQTFAIFIASSTNRLTLSALSNDDVGDYSLELVSTLANYPTVTSTIELFDIAIFENPNLDIILANSQTDSGSTTNDTSQGNSTDSEAQSAAVTSNDSDDVEGDDSKIEFIPRYVVSLGKMPDAPNLGKRTYASVKIAEITPLGLMTLRLNETVIQHRLEEYTSLTSVDFEVIYVKNSEEEDQEMTYEITQVSPTEIQVSLTFEKPYLVSQAQISDQIIVKMNKDFFLIPSRMALGNTVVEEDEDPYSWVYNELPKMLGSQEELSTLESIGSSAKVVITVAIIVPLVVGIGLKGIMAKLWAMLNTIQLIDALSIISVSVPANVLQVQKVSHSIINFQPIDKDLVYALIFGEDSDDVTAADDTQVGSGQSADTLRRLVTADSSDIADDETDNGDLISRLDELSLKEPISQALSNFDFSAEALLKGMLLLGLLLATALVLMACVYFCVKKCINRCHPTLRKLCLTLKGMLMYNSVLRYFMMVFLSTSIGCCLQVQTTMQNPNLLKKVESIISIAILASFLILTIVLTRHIFRNVKNLARPTFRQAYGTLYSPCETRRGKWPLIYITIFCGRRLLVAIIVSFLPGYPLTQIACTAILSHLVLVWHVQVWPMENTRQNVLYLLNEYLYLACCLYTMGFTEYNADPLVRFSQGWFYLGFIGAILVANVTVLILDGCGSQL